MSIANIQNTVLRRVTLILFIAPLFVFAVILECGKIILACTDDVFETFPETWKGKKK